MVGVLVGWELRVESPFIDMHMLVRNGALTRTCLRMLITYTGMYLMVYGFAQWLQDAAGYSADHAGLIQLSTTAFALVCSWIVARSSSVRKPLIAGSVPLLPGALLMVFVDAGSSLVYLLLLVGVFGITQGLGSVSNQEVVYHNSSEGTDRAGVRAVPHGDPDRGDHRVQHHRTGVRGVRHRCRRAHARMDSAGARTGRYAAHRDG